MGQLLLHGNVYFFNGVVSLAFISTNMNTKAYKEILEAHILPNAVDLAGESGFSYRIMP